MITLVITVCLLALGKINAQETVVLPVVYTQSLPATHALYMSDHREFNHQFPSSSPPLLQLKNTRPPLTNRRGVDNLPPAAVRENPPPRLFISRRIAERMNELRPADRTTNASNNSPEDENNSAVRDNVDFGKSTTKNDRRIPNQQDHSVQALLPSNTPERQNTHVATDFGHVKNDEQTNHLRNPHVVASQTITPLPLPNHEAKTNKPMSSGHLPVANTTEITLDERSNFDGDQCPTGYVRVAGMCVLPE